MQSVRIVVALTAHEHTSLKIEDTTIVDAQYRWEEGMHNSKIELTAKQPGTTAIAIVDHETGEKATLKVEVTARRIPHLAVDKPEANMLDMMTFHLYNEDQTPINIIELGIVCDSMVWSVEGVHGSYKVFEHKEGKDWVDNQLTSKWGQCFSYPGSYKTLLTAWKDNKAILQNTLNISISNHKDFLCYNWSDIVKDSQAWDSYTDVLKSGPNLISTYGLSGAVPFVEVRLWNSIVAQSYDTLYGYLSRLYSAPTYEDKTDKQKMWQKYDELFSEQKRYADAYPVAIWTNGRVHIVLLLLNESSETLGPIVYAEPHRP